MPKPIRFVSQKRMFLQPLFPRKTMWTNVAVAALGERGSVAMPPSDL